MLDESIVSFLIYCCAFTSLLTGSGIGGCSLVEQKQMSAAYEITSNWEKYFLLPDTYFYYGVQDPKQCNIYAFH